MLRSPLTFISFCALLLCTNLSSSAWGIWAHYRINGGAALLLPDSLGLFFLKHLDYVTEESVVPDVRKHELKDHAESIRHYIDLEGYKVNNTATLPVDMKSATARFSNDTLSKYGTLPWTIVEYMKLLTEAFRHKNKAEILFLASDLGHYIGDAHMPLHTSINHDGQFTNQDGIHGLWEAQLPELFGAQYHLNVAPNAQYITNITETTMSLVDHSHALVDSLLDADKKTRMG